ncbi:hypothetical protein TFKS16_0005 [Tannerella forsythia KS16]|jgi:hypothetical protein|uniref:Uncharacterized protein n=3 Tax=Tannerella forsythia TaxID=28112 RepID=G8UQE3_TANFA|nr:hypothetical protein [Tannerella forsythia]AEW22512.1 hypothetical protein BFO_0005 [Tannerella forsythia 92A2]BAR47622.1 hypothetical protein TF3313_0005 [Tannerella forsythia 3313]BAR50365.1 hypothetical protein TFKS16_0005 [Tannerella forsythia KS16]PDP43560.1 hypothetical protein CLI86_07685 [Tannerella forsythia]PDP70618.1 hypothetical protein CLI85_08485 [Tannerella forsythia]
MSALRYLGVLVLLIGVIVLAIPAISGSAGSNVMLVLGLVLVLLGYVGHIMLNKNSKRIE